MNKINKTQNWASAIALVGLLLYLGTFFLIRQPNTSIDTIRLAYVAVWVFAGITTSYLGSLSQYIMSGKLFPFSAFNIRIKKFDNKTFESPEIVNEIQLGQIITATLTVILLIAIIGTVGIILK